VSLAQGYFMLESRLAEPYGEAAEVFEMAAEENGTSARRAGDHRADAGRNHQPI